MYTKHNAELNREQNAECDSECNTECNAETIQSMQQIAIWNALLNRKHIKIGIGRLNT